MKRNFSNQKRLGAAFLASVLTLTGFSGCGTEDSPAPSVAGQLPAEDSSENAGESEDLAIKNLDDIKEPISSDQPETEAAGQEGSEEAESGTLAKDEPEDEIITITISAVGDVSLGNYRTQGYDLSFDQTYDIEQSTAYYLQNVKSIFEADDMTVVNLEGPLTNAEEIRTEKEFEIKGNPEYVKILTDGDVEMATIANNHILDYKEQGRQDTVALLEGEGIRYAYDTVLATYEVKGIKIGAVAVSCLAKTPESEKNLQEGIQSLKEQGADIILACCHWGIERKNYPEEYQINLGRQCIDWGADVVLGCHPHVLQSIEKYHDKYILYSMGNFCFGANRNPPDKDSMIFQPTFTFVNGEKQDEIGLHIIPCSISSVSDRNNYQPTPVEGDEAVRIIDRINEFSRDYQVQFDYDGNLLESK